jgi:signal peptide peptidase SppA
MMPGALQRVLTAHVSAIISTDVVDAAERLNVAQTASQEAQKVAVVPLTGVITPRGSLLSLLFGGGPGGLEGFRSQFREAVHDPEVGAVVLDVDSPGGLVKLVPETAAEIRGARGAKPIVAQVNTLAASAAYWLAAQADEIVMTPSGQAGSIGVYMLHEDWSGANAKAGVDPTFIYAGKYKVEGNPEEALSDEGKAHWQSEADDIYAMFVSDVAQGRGTLEATVRNSYGEGRTLLGERALSAGLVDRLDTLHGTVSRLLGAAEPAPAPTDSLEGRQRTAALLFS